MMVSTTTNDDDDDIDDEGDDEMLLVTEFPPPPHYYALASSRGVGGRPLLTPPEIPVRAFRVIAKRVRAERRRARMESDRIRREATAGDGDGSGVGGIDDMIEEAEEDEDDDSIDVNDPNEPVIACFGEIVEDPTLDIVEECLDPIVIRENVRKLNRDVLNGFLKLVHRLADDPNDSRLSLLHPSLPLPPTPCLFFSPLVGGVSRLFFLARPLLTSCLLLPCAHPW
jgi:mediator of RNA polymerase II transcription subunit 7